MGKLQSKHACKRRENPEGDSFVVNAFLRRGMEECERYSSTDHKLKNMQKASCEPSSLNEKHVAGIQNSGVFQHGPGRHLFLVCTAKSWSRERGCGGNGVGEGGGEEEKEEEEE
ncbi:Protein naked cuticle-like protein 2 [Larimichthys crocea]|uniref:Uncharacterized protein n=1 Tax=Larimichthys crocea TaxID=215358 RepID=A0ACD3QVK7_LARCR|nr:Protein naked cuticle-like protein 2 [Larimichthys crocea]